MAMRTARVRVDHLPTLVQHTRLEPFPDQPQEWPIVDTQLEHLHELVMVDPVEEALMSISTM